MRLTRCEFSARFQYRVSETKMDARLYIWMLAVGIACGGFASKQCALFAARQRCDLAKTHPHLASDAKVALSPDNNLFGETLILALLFVQWLHCEKRRPTDVDDTTLAAADATAARSLIRRVADRLEVALRDLLRRLIHASIRRPTQK